MLIVQRIRKEYGKPFREVVTKLADKGFSMRATAGILDVSEKQFYRLVNQYGLKACFDRSKYNDSCRPKGMGWPAGKSRASEMRYQIKRKTGVYMNVNKDGLLALFGGPHDGEMQCYNLNTTHISHATSKEFLGRYVKNADLFTSKMISVNGQSKKAATPKITHNS